MWSARERIEAAIALEVPDRVPVAPLVDSFAARYANIPIQQFMSDHGVRMEAMKRAFLDLGPWDMVFPGDAVNEKLLAIGVPIEMRMPGRDLPATSIHQFVEKEVMLPEDYDYIIERGFVSFLPDYLPRIGAAAIAENLLQTLSEETALAAQEAREWEGLGAEVATGGAIPGPPLDWFCMARSMWSFFPDLRDRPEKVLLASERYVSEMTPLAAAMADQTGVSRIWIGGARCSSTFLSAKHFEKFVWPFLKQMVEELVARDLVVLLHFDADWTAFLPYLRQLPRAKCILELDGTTDIFAAKEILSGHMCLMGDVPASLLSLGEPAEVANYCRRLIREVGRDGGFILSSGCCVPIDAKPENVRAMFSAATAEA